MFVTIRRNKKNKRGKQSTSIENSEKKQFSGSRETSVRRRRRPLVIHDRR